MTSRLLSACAIAATALVVFAATGTSSAVAAATPTHATVQSTTTADRTAAPKGALLSTRKTPLGTILVNAKGRTVYLFAADSPGSSACTGACLSYWPAVVAPATVPASLPGVTGRLGALTRDDGTRQLTINGRPLYTYAGDTKAGMTSGQGSTGSGAKWWVVSPSGRKITAAS